MKKLIFSILLLMNISSLKAQLYAYNVPLMTDTWELIAEKYYENKGTEKWEVLFPAALQAKKNKIIELPGYMIPIKAGLTHSHFFLSVLPVSQCDYCGTGGIPAMIEVQLNKPIRFSEEPIRIKGKLVLYPEIIPPASDVFLIDAEMVK